MLELKVTFCCQEYMSHTRSEYGVYQWDPSNNYYKACLKWHLSFSMSPEEVHQKGLDEVNRISGEMEKVGTIFVDKKLFSVL